MTVKEKMERLLKDEEIEVPINLETIIYGIEKNEDNIWGLMLGTGYLKVVEVINAEKDKCECKVKIPNEETRKDLENVLKQSEKYGEPIIPTELRKGNDKFSNGLNQATNYFVQVIVKNITKVLHKY